MIIDNIEHENIPSSISVCDTSKISIAMQICIVYYALKSIMHTVLIIVYVIFSKNFLSKHMFAQTVFTTTFHHFAILYQEQPIVCLMLARTKKKKKWSVLSSYNKIDIRCLTFPHPSTYCILPTQEQMFSEIQEMELPITSIIVACRP